MAHTLIAGKALTTDFHGTIHSNNHGFTGHIDADQHVGHHGILKEGFDVSGDWHGHNTYHGTLNYTNGGFSVGGFVGGIPGHGMNYGGGVAFTF